MHGVFASRAFVVVLAVVVVVVFFFLRVAVDVNVPSVWFPPFRRCYKTTQCAASMVPQDPQYITRMSSLPPLAVARKHKVVASERLECERILRPATLPRGLIAVLKIIPPLYLSESPGRLFEAQHHFFFSPPRG